MKIILATPLYPPEIEHLSTYVKDLAEHLKNDHQITVLAYAGQVEKTSGVNIFTINKHQPLWLRILVYTFKLFKLARSADLIYAQNAVASGLPAILVKYLLKIPVVINFAEDEAWKRALHDDLTTKSFPDFLASPIANRKIRLFKNLQGWVLRRATAIVVSSETLAQIVARTYRLSAKLIMVNYQPAEKPEILPLVTEKVQQQIVFRGKLFPWSNLPDLLPALAILKKDWPQVKLLVSGEGPAKESFKELAQKFGVAEQVDFLGRVSKAENWYLLKNSQVYLPDSQEEISYHLILEGWLAKIPMVALATPLAKEIFFNSKDPVVEPGREDVLAQKIAILFKEQKFCQEVIDSGEKVLLSKFFWPRHLSVLSNLFNSVQKK
jgi:glycosyltransferase involved in cell wall biosynthesis